MDPSATECELNHSSSEGHVEYPDGRKLSDSVHRMEGEPVSTTSKNSLFQTADGCAPTRTRRTHIGQRQALSLSTSVSSSDESSEPKRQTLEEEKAEFFKNPFRRWSQKKKRKKTKRSSFLGSKTKGSRRVGKSRLQFSVPLAERNRRMFHRGIKFPFKQLKYLPFKMYFSYEQFALGGFLKQIKNLTFERSLKESLKDVKMDQDSEIEDFHVRHCKYMDEDGPLSPISESEENLNEDEAEVKVVKNSTFILDAQVPTKEEWQIKAKGGKKDNQHTQK